MRFNPVVLLGLLIFAAATSSAQSDAAHIVKFQVFPPNAQLSASRDHQSLVVQAVLANGLTQDITAQAQIQVADASRVRLEGNVIYPVADGTTELRVTFAKQTVVVRVEVHDAAVDRPISFQLDVMPVFLKAGCNTGSCHGSARGKDGFRLSLFGFDPDGDYFRLTREIPGRRINLARPEASLLLEKATGRVPHTGGKRFPENAALYQTLLRWHEAGAPQDAGEVPHVVAVELRPDEAVLDGEQATQQLNVRAVYSDGTNRDVTALAVFSSSNDHSATVANDGLVTAHARGEAFLTARFDTQTVGTHFIVLPKGLEFDPPKTPEFNYIDTLVHQKLNKLRVIPSELCTDEEFLRRAYLDIVGLLPTVEEYTQFVESQNPKKRDDLVDELLSRKEFVELWVMKWAELLQIRTTRQISVKSMSRYYNWLEKEIAGNVPMDQMVQELLGSSGGTFSNAATNYYQTETDTLKVAENVAQVFMGMRIQCTQCHNHPFDRWTMNDYYSFAAFFAQIGRKKAEDPRELIVYNRGSGEVKHPVGNRVMAPKFLGGDTPDVKGKDRRVVLAKWLASPENPYFARNLANIVWAHFLGRGIVEPVDDVRVSNPPVNVPLLNELARRFTNYNYDFKKLVRDICTSRTYQLSTETNETNASDTTNFSHANLRRIRAEILFDAISEVTLTENKFPGLPQGARAVQIANGNTSSYFLTTFGRATRETPCSCEVKMAPNLSQALHLLNGDTINNKIRQGRFIETQLKAGKTPDDILNGLYIACLSRTPTAKESSALSEMLAAEPNKQPVLEDIAWSLLNSREFLFNH